ncbi:MAG: aryl-alcohol dehydrogenase-like predicted oxidoreductase/enamine deaminase RidA [Lysobacterales bacterium]|jgi:aryl-alcohol dehydrogenase-like predicted oxidoreductase/enamine deaminase RidA (YjgF/YER057c/UK114 family)
MRKIEKLELAPGFEISRVLTGLWQVADLERDGNTLEPETTAKFMQPYVDAGFTTFDMADHYGSAEIIAGQFRNGEPGGKQAQLLTKWVPKPGAVSKQEVRAAVQRSLDRMQVEQLDMLQYHAWNYADPAWLDSLFHLMELKQEGLIAHLGLTNFDAAHLRVACASGIEIVSNQVSYSLLDQRASGDMTEVCEQYGVNLLAFGTLAGGFLSEKWLGNPEPASKQLTTWSQMKYKRFIDTAGGWQPYQQLLGSLDKIASKYGTSISTVVSRYMLDQPMVGGIILGARLGQNDHIKENLGIFELKLDPQDHESIQQAASQLQLIPGDCGDEYRKPPFLTATGDLSDHLESIPRVFEPVQSDDGKTRVFSGVSWEDFAGYSRAIRSGDRICVSGTTASHGDQLIGGKDPAAQMHFVIDKIQAAIESLGGSLEDVERTRIFVSNIDHWEPVAQAHGQRFRHIKPVNTLVEAKLVGPEFLLEVEAEAYLRQR